MATIESTSAVGAGAALAIQVAQVALPPFAASSRPVPGRPEIVPVSRASVSPASASPASAPARVREGSAPAAGPSAPGTIDDRRQTQAAERPESDAPERPRTLDLLRTRLDPETLRLFTEVIDPVTREARYRVPPTAISEAAERESEFRARYERMTRPPASPAEAVARLT